MIWFAVVYIALAVASAVLTIITLKILRHKSILDHPNERSSHTLATPRGGGIAVFVIIIIVWVITYLQDRPPHLYLPIISASMLAGISWLDDLKSLSARLRFSVQVLAVAISIPWALAAGSITQGLLPNWLEILLMTIAWVGFINFFNFMDGIDGISGVESIGIGGGLVIVFLLTNAVVPHPYLGLSIAAAASGFLWFNWHPARIFLGDVGSISIGFLLGGLLLQMASLGHWQSALILPLYYLSDAGITLLKRALRGEKVWQAHREHFYQFAIQQGRTHTLVSIAVAITNILLIGLSVLAINQPYPALGAAIVVVGILLIWMSRPAVDEANP